MSEQRVHQVREWVAEAQRVYQWERERYGWYRVAVVFTWKRAKRVVREFAWARQEQRAAKRAVRKQKQHEAGAACAARWEESCSSASFASAGTTVFV